MKKLMYLSITVMCLSVTLLVGINIGQGPANAQGTGSLVSIAANYAEGNAYVYYLLDDGSLYVVRSHQGWASELLTNVFNGPVTTESTTWGQLKQKYGEDN